MISPGILYTTAALLTLLAVACTALCFAWSIPAWRRRLGRTPRADGLSGWPARVGSSLVSAGLASCALVAWYGLYCALAAI
jgi:hypothetical protein